MMPEFCFRPSYGGDSENAFPLRESHACDIPLSSSMPEDCDLRLLRGGKAFRPRFCPHAHCPYHHSGPRQGGWYIRWGFYQNRSFGRIQRYRCRRCGGSFSEMSFSLDIYIKRRIDYRKLEHSLCDGAGVRATARRLGISTGSVANRVQRSGRNAFACLSRLSSSLTHRESLAFDGFRSFTVSQHAPCDLTHLIGRHSEYIYLFDYAPLRRGGTMSAKQKRSRARFEKRMKPSPDASERSAYRLYDEIIRCGIWPPKQNEGVREIWSDEHHAYHRAWHRHPGISHAAERGWVEHRTISSRAARTKNNPLRSVNYFDRELRKDLAEHRRETVCFSRTPFDMIARFALYVVHHNMDKPQRIRGSRSPGAAERVAKSHAVGAGAPPEVVAALSLWRVSARAFLSRENIGDFADMWWRGSIPTPPDIKWPHVPAYATA